MGVQLPPSARHRVPPPFGGGEVILSLLLEQTWLELKTLSGQPALGVCDLPCVGWLPGIPRAGTRPPLQSSANCEPRADESTM